MKEKYAHRFETALRPIAARLELDLTSMLSGIKNIDRISARAKDVDSFLKKAAKVNQKEGSLKYPDPLNEIQDQVGARVIVYFKDDVEIVAQRIKQAYTSIEEVMKGSEDIESFGYEGRHFIAFIPSDIANEIDEKEEIPRFFELQVKTVFQHAWAAANHDIVYKSPVELSPEQKRMCAYAAAQAWGADRIFDGLINEISANRELQESQLNLGLKT